MTHAIEGDIKGAYDNVNHDILINLLKEKISDKKFINLIYRSLKANILEEGRNIHPLTGVPQGRIASPILFNIYMHEFDQAVVDIVSMMLLEKNILEGRVKGKEAKTYKKLSNEVDKYRNRIKSEKKRNNFKLIQENKMTFRKFQSKMLKTKSRSQKQNWLTFSYTRYADDWIIFTNADEQTCLEIKEALAKWLLQKLKLELSAEKTIVTDISKRPAKFLGYTFTFDPKKRIVIKVARKKCKYPVKQNLNIGAIIGIDNERVQKRFSIEKIINNKLFPVGVTKYLSLSSYEIVLKFKSKIEGLFNYYFENLTFKSKLIRYYYYLRFSCAKTLCRKENLSLKAIFVKYGSCLKVTRSFVVKDKEGNLEKKSQSMLFPSWSQLMKKFKARSKDLLIQTKKRQAAINRSKESYPKDEDAVHTNTGIYWVSRNELSFEKAPYDDPFDEVFINQRTIFKFRKYCCICGKSPTHDNPLESHHLKHIRKGKIVGFAEIMRRLNRRQIIVCRNCHRKIHNGEYDSISLSSFYDPTIAEI